LLSPESSLIVGNMVVIDGGTDAIVNVDPPRSNDRTTFPSS
jgi:hypothetical protein